jgi:hypothetical protein
MRAPAETGGNPPGTLASLAIHQDGLAAAEGDRVRRDSKGGSAPGAARPTRNRAALRDVPDISPRSASKTARIGTPVRAVETRSTDRCGSGRSVRGRSCERLQASLLRLRGVGQAGCTLLAVFPGFNDATLDCLLVPEPFLDHICQLRFAEVSLHNHHQIQIFRPERARRAECFPDQTLSAISNDGISHLAAGGDPEPRGARTGRWVSCCQKEHEVTGRDAPTLGLNPLKLRALANPLRGGESSARQGDHGWVMSYF